MVEEELWKQLWKALLEHSSKERMRTLVRAVLEMEKTYHKFSQEVIKDNALRFNKDNFKRNFKKYVFDKYREFYNSLGRD